MDYAQLDRSLEKVNQTLRTLDEREARISELEIGVAQTSLELERYNSKLHEKEQENVHWQEKFAIADREMALIESEMEKSEGKNQRLEADLRHLQKQFKHLQRDLDEERRRADQDADQRDREYEVEVFMLSVCILHGRKYCQAVSLYRVAKIDWHACRLKFELSTK